MHRLITLLALAIPLFAAGKPAPKTLEELRQLSPDVEFQFVSDIEGGTGFTASLHRYRSAGLTVHAMLARPVTAPPPDGYPVLVFNHGHHPDPPRYGITADGKDHRPGDYYRQIPELYVKHGYLVVIPDYRGHSNSEGREFTGGFLDAVYYTEDVVNLLHAIDVMPGANPDRVFMMGHSMGGDVTLRAALASDRVRAASLWSTVGGTLWEQAFYYSRVNDPFAPDSSSREKQEVTRLRAEIQALDEPFQPERVDPTRYLDGLSIPVILHHAVDDRSTAYRWSSALAEALYLNGKTYAFFSYRGSDHLFNADDLELAVARDVAFFAQAVEQPSSD